MYTNNSASDRQWNWNCVWKIIQINNIVKRKSKDNCQILQKLKTLRRILESLRQNNNFCIPGTVCHRGLCNLNDGRKFLCKWLSKFLMEETKERKDWQTGLSVCMVSMSQALLDTQFTLLNSKKRTHLQAHTENGNFILQALIVSRTLGQCSMYCCQGNGWRPGSLLNQMHEQHQLE